MNMQVYTIEAVNIYQKPDMAQRMDCSQVTIGDLHANAMKFLYFLIAEGVFDLSDEDYRTLATIYLKDINTVSDAVLKADIQTFNDIIENRLSLNQSKLVRLIGDEVGDRGQNDYFILKILQKLHDSKVPVEIMMSNHGVELVSAIEKLDETGSLQRSVLHHHHARSLDNLELLRKRGIIGQADIVKLTNVAYKPQLKALSYSLNKDQNEITLFSHAAIDLRVVQYMAQKLDLKYEDATAKSLAQTIDNINASVQLHIKRGTFHAICSEQELVNGYDGNITLNPDNPFEFAMWNREYEYAIELNKRIERVAEHNGYCVNYVHGHDSEDPCNDEDHICNLDGMLGKDLYINFFGQYKVLASNDTTLNCAKDISITVKKAKDVVVDRNTSNTLDLPSMFIIGGFVAAVGLAAVAIAISVLSLGAIPAMAAGVVCSGIALVTALATCGFFNSPPLKEIAPPPVEIDLTGEMDYYV